MRTVGIVGLGYVGLPLAVHFADRGYYVIAYDIDSEKIESLREQVSYIEDVADADIKRVFGRLCPTTDVSEISRAECISVCVPTPVSGTEPDIGPIMSAVRALEGHVAQGAVLVIESTVYPNFTQEKVAPLFPDAHVVFSPERVDPRNDKYAIEDIPKVIGADSPYALEKAREFYEDLFTLKEVSSTASAEMSKLLENTYRAVNIALVNEFARISSDLGIDVWEVISAAATKPFGFQPFYPSLGVGGHCIPVDPYYLLHKGESAFVRSALEINERNIERCADMISENVDLEGSHVLFLGVAYKPDVGDCRESPALKLWDIVSERMGAGLERLRYCDPHVAEFSAHDHVYTSESDLIAAVGASSCVVVCVNHSAYGLYKSGILDLCVGSRSIFDFCGMFAGDSRVIGL